jgi:TatD DNase family protein
VTLPYSLSKKPAVSLRRAKPQDMIELVDTHCHIQSAGLASGGEHNTQALWAKSPELTASQLVANAKEQGVNRLIVVGCDLEDSQLATQFVTTHENCWAAIGIHPHEAKVYAGQKDLKAQFAALTSQPKVVAIGECGLDYYYNHSSQRAQAELLHYQIELAQNSDLPLIFHVREAFTDFWPIFDSYSKVRGVLHSFTDSADNLRKALDKGLMIGVNGIATFVKDPAQLEVYRSIPLENLVLETDAPFLAPIPFRGKTNEPKYVSTIAAFMANLHQTDVETIASITTANARKLFGI